MSVTLRSVMPAYVEPANCIYFTLEDIWLTLSTTATVYYEDCDKTYEYMGKAVIAGSSVSFIPITEHMKVSYGTTYYFLTREMVTVTSHPEYCTISYN